MEQHGDAPHLGVLHMYVHTMEMVEEALQAYRADLGLDNTLSRAAWHLDNVWSLHGYVECLKRLGRDAEAAAAKIRLDLAMARADVEITASCFCRVGARCCN